MFLDKLIMYLISNEFYNGNEKRREMQDKENACVWVCVCVRVQAHM